MWQTAIDQPRDAVARKDRRGEGVACDSVSGPGRKKFTMLTPPVRLQIDHAALVDITVGVAHTGDAWIRGEVRDHVFMQQLLQIQREGIAVGPDDDIGADAGGAGQVAIGVGQCDVARVVRGGHANLCTGGNDEFCKGRCGRTLRQLSGHSGVERTLEESSTQHDHCRHRHRQ